MTTYKHYFQNRYDRQVIPGLLEGNYVLKNFEAIEIDEGDILEEDDDVDTENDEVDEDEEIDFALL